MTTSCTICLQPFIESSETLAILSCGHALHQTCLPKEEDHSSQCPFRCSTFNPSLAYPIERRKISRFSSESFYYLTKETRENLSKATSQYAWINLTRCKATEFLSFLLNEEKIELPNRELKNKLLNLIEDKTSTLYAIIDAFKVKKESLSSQESYALFWLDLHEDFRTIWLDYLFPALSQIFSPLSYLAEKTQSILSGFMYWAFFFLALFLIWPLLILMEKITLTVSTFVF